MLRPLVALAALASAVFLLAPTVQSVAQGVEALDIQRELPWQVWKWDYRPEPPSSLLPPDCDERNHQMVSEVTEWPTRIRKDERFTLGGTVVVPEQDNRGVMGVRVELFLNETKELPGDYLGEAITTAEGTFSLTTSIPFELQATKYHLVAHALQKREGCITFKEHWSDPEMEVVSQTTLVLDELPKTVIGHEIVLGGVLIDSVGAPVKDAKVILTAGHHVWEVRTGEDGRFAHPYRPSGEGNRTVTARYDGSEYYSGSKDEGVLQVVGEDVRLAATLGPHGLELERSAWLDLSGQVVLAEGRGDRDAPIVLLLDGRRLEPCDGCPPTDRIEAKRGDNGTFSVRLRAPPSTEPGAFSFRVEGGGLRERHTFAAAVFVPVKVELTAAAPGLLSRTLEGSARATDDAGARVDAVAVRVGDAWVPLAAAGDGTYAYSVEPPCGKQVAQAHHNGTEWTRPGMAQAEATACPLLSMMPPWLVWILFDMPWWGWALVVLTPLAAWYAASRLRERYAATIARGPPLTLTFTEPRDAAAGIVGVGETALATAYLEEPLPAGHRLRMGPPRDMQDVEVGPDLRASVPLTPERLGETHVRADVLDGRGRVVSRRTATLRAVHYAAEIERRHLALLQGTHGERADKVSPREFEAWLQERAPHLDADVARRLVGVFEEADYGPRDAGRRELIAYLEAQQALPEVTVPAAR